ncbi:TrbC/VirB2 family protein [Candidatus Anaplasma sp. TIGMIC]|uniref:TrbC/VirB2 family protein n=1 Tax=Candidatus Anaplasma sp. TIGMIC TaxID=3020713 RepID=UPI00232D3E91|nr:TrbC/VirB2 family protein [Candidatus Anaplasma sp. TIGMIC]MDB1135674.1 TrbC/VirB2 family protein [Candidatus Anaplasma sp. TIGMIC]
MFTNILRTCVASVTIFIFLMFPMVSVGATGTRGYASDEEVVSKVICNVVVFVQKLGLPIMTGVILGSSIMAVFGRLAWPAIVMLVVFTAIFFGAGKLIAKFAGGIAELGAEDFDCHVLAGRGF